MHGNTFAFASFSVFVGVCQGAATSASLTKSAFLDADENFELYWKFDDSTITFEVQVNTLGWVGLGISPNGDMTGSDIVIGWVDSAGTGHLKDRYATGRLLPPIDDHQDWILKSSSQTDTKTIMQFQRNLKPCDQKDLDISDATARVIWAYHTADPASESEILQHTARGAKSVILLMDPMDPPALPPDSFEWTLAMSSDIVPMAETMYLCRAFNIHESVNIKHHAIKIDNIIHSGNENYVHHIVVYACPNPVLATDLVNSSECSDFGPRYDCDADFYAWAIGSGPFVLPEHVGFPFGEADSPQALVMEIHYTNPERAVIVDSSGVVLTLTPTLRQYDAGTINAGIFVNMQQLIPPGSPAFVYHGHCPSNCLSEAMSASHETKIHVFGGGLHAHLTGRKMRTRHFRNGVELPPIFEDDHYDFDYQEYRLRENVEVLSGDNLMTECTYDTSDKSDIVWGGLGTKEEMCMTFVLYYPKINLTNCATAPLREVYMPALNLSYSGMWHTDMIELNGLTWTAALKDTLQSLMTDPTQTVSTRCEMSGVFQSSENNQNVTPDAITKEYTTPVVECSNEIGGTGGSEKTTSVMFLLFVSALVAVNM